MPAPRRRTWILALIALTTAMGVHTLRGFFAMVVWNIGVDRSIPVVGGVAFAVYALGLAGWFVAPPRLEHLDVGTRRAVFFAAVYALSHLVRHPLLTPALALAAAIAWLWFLPAAIGRASRREATGTLTSGVLVGFALQVALQTGLHGLDLSMLRGLAPGLGAAVLAALLLVSWRALTVNDGSQAEAPALPGWGLIVLGPYLMLQLALLANVGRVQMLTGASLPIAALPIFLGLTAGAAAVTRPWPLIVRVVAAAASIILVVPAWLARQGTVFLIVAQIALAIALAGALRAGDTRRVVTTFAAGAVGMLLGFVAMFLYYSRYEWPSLWPLLAALVAIPALLSRGPGREQVSLAGAAAAAIVALIGLTAGVVPPRSAAAPVPSASGTLRVFDYNIQMGFDASGVPDPLRIARAIESARADVIALQEVGRGWTVNGGVDLFAWLRWRFRGYYAIYGPMNGDLWGNAILSRYPVSGQGSLRFPVRVSRFQRGLTWASLSFPGGELLVVATHLSYETETDRLEQSGDLLGFWRGRRRTIVMGDFNDEPDSAAITRVLAAGLRDALAPLGLRNTPTYHASTPTRRIDYVFITPDFEPVSGGVPRTTASDHLPVVVQLRLQ